MKRVDLNVDIGEGFPWDVELLAFATSANVCCGAHAGSVELALRTAEMCLGAGVRVGAHPGYPDRAGFGRRGWADLEEEVREGLEESLRRQVAVLAEVASYVKPHGGLYNDSARAGEAAVVLGRVLERAGLAVMGLAGSGHEAVALASGVGLIREGFADRGYSSDGFLIPRGETGAVLGTVEAKVAQAVWLAGLVDSICLHGDEEDCVATIRAVREGLEAAGFEVGF